MDEQERQRKREAGREKLAAFLKKKRGSPTGDEKAKNPRPTPRPSSAGNSSPSSDGIPSRPTHWNASSQDEALSSVGLGQTTGENVAETTVPTIQNESLHSSVCNRETCNILSTRVKELEETLAGKERDLNILREELATCKDFSVDASTGMLSFGMEADYVTHIDRYQKRLEEFAEAVKERDGLIDQLSEKLKSSNQVRAALQTKEEQLAQDVALLQKQLHHTKEIFEGHVWDTGIKPQDFFSLQSQLLALEDTVTKNKSVINGLNAALQQRDMALQAQTEELEKKSQELSQHKTKSAKEIQELMREVEELNQRSVLFTSADSQNLADLRAQLEEAFGLQLVQFKEEFRKQLDEKNKALQEAGNTIVAQEHQLADTVTVFKSEILSYKLQVDALNVERQEAAAMVDRLTSELGSYNVDLALQKEQNQAINERVKDTTERNERLSHELLTLQSCQQAELSSYKKQIEDLSLQLQQSKERLHQGELVHVSGEDPTEVQRLKCQLADIQEKHINEISQLRFSYSKELESYRHRNDTLEWELDNTSRNKEKCTAELNACKEAYIAQWGSSKHAQDMEIVGLKEQISALKIQIQEMTSVKEIPDNCNSNVETSKPLSETDANSERESLKLQVKDAWLAQDSLSREIMGHKLEIAVYKQEKDGLEQSLREISMLEEQHRSAGLEQQRELDRYKQQVEGLNQRISSNEQEIERLQESNLHDELSRVSDLLSVSVNEKEHLSKRLEASKKKYEEEMASYEEKLRSINLEVDNLTKGHLEILSSYHEAQSLNTSLGDQIQTLKCEVLSYKKQLESAKVKALEDLTQANVKHEEQLKECKERIETVHAQYKEYALVITTYSKELQFWNQQIRELNSQLAKELNVEVPDFEVNVNADKSVHEQLVMNIKNNFTTLQHFIKSREESFHSATSQLEDSTLKLLSAQSTLVSVTEINKQPHDNSTLAPAVDEELADLKQQLIDKERLLETKTNSKLALEKHVENLESKLLQLSTNSASMKESLQETTVKLVAAEALSAAKDELEIGLKNRISELEDALHKVNEDSLSIRLESEQVSEKVAKARDLLERMRAENNELSALCKLYEDDASQLREQLLSSEQRVKNLLSQVKPVNETVVEQTSIEEVYTEQTAPQLSAQALRSSVLPTSATHIEHDASQQQADLGNLALQIQQFEKYQEELVMRCNRYEEEVGRLREELVTSENSLESLRQEVSNNKSSQSLEQNSLSPPNRDETAMVQTEASSAFNKREMILSGGDSAPLNEYSFLGRGFDFGFNMSGQTLNNTEYMGMDDLKTSGALKLIENCSFLENVRNELVGNVQDLQAKIQEFELNEKFYKEELEMSNQRCKVFGAKVAEMTKALETLECKIVSQSALENKILHLESEKTILQDMQANLHTELVAKQLVYEEKLSKMLHEQLSNSFGNTQGSTIEEMISELGSKAKELIILSEKLKSKKETETALHTRLRMMEESYQSCITQLTCCKDEMFNVRKELEESWQKQRQTENELARVRRELKITQLSKEQLEKSQSRLKDVSLVENLESTKVSVLKQALQQASNNRSLDQSDRSRVFTAEDISSSTHDFIDNQISTIRGKLECMIQQNESFTDGIDGAEKRNGQSGNHQTSLTAELSAYREQHVTLAEVLGFTGILQEALHRQKQELLQKTHEKATIDELIEKERTKLHEAELKVEMLQMDLKQKDDIQMALNGQKYALAEELQDIEERLSERESTLENERLRLEAEIRQRDLSIRQWELKCRAQQVEHSTEHAVSRMTASPLPSPRSIATQQLDLVKSDLNAAHTQTMQRMRIHLAEQFSTSERKLQKSHRAELLSIHEEHKKKLATIQRELQDKTKELEALKQLENQREKQLIDFDEWKNKLDENQKEIYTQMQQQFETYAQHQIEGAMKRLQDEHELILSSQKAVHEQEIRELQVKLEQQNEAELLGIQEALTKQHNQELTEVEERLKAEIAHHKEIINPFPTDSKEAMLLLKQLVCSEFTSSFKLLVDSRHETYRKEMVELISQLEEVMKREDLNTQAEIPQLLESQEKLLTQTEELLARVVTEHECMLDGLEAALDAGHEKLLAHLKRVTREAETTATTASLQDKISALEDEKQELLQQHAATVDLLTTNHGAEVTRLQELLSVSGIECGPCVYLRRELEAKHTSEMEELRHYFEKKCTELEKHYSEEVFSQHSRKLSSSSSCESELAADIYYTGGEQGHRINTLTHMCDSYTIEPSYKELEEHYQRDHEKRIIQYREQLDTIKHSIEEKYSSEMETLKEGYDMKVEELVRELAANHSVEIKELESKHLKDMENLRTQLGAEAKKKEDNARNEAERTRQDLESSHLQDLEKLKKTFEERLSVDIECLTDRMLQDEADHIRIIKEELQEKHETEVARLKAALAGRTEEHERRLRQLDEKHRADVERERAAISEQVDQLTAVVKQGAEREQEAFLVAQKEMMQGFLAKHQEDMKTLKEHHESQLRDAQEEVHKLQQEHAEYNEQIRQSKRRLHDEIQHDVLKALIDQLQVLLSEEVDEKSWPAELLQLQDKMAARYKREMAALQHDVERLRDELERVKSVKDSVEEQSARAQPVESVGVKQMAATLKCVIGEIVQYMSVCEEELNNTLVNQILKYDWENMSANESTGDHASLFRDAPNDSSIGLLPNMSLVGNLDLGDRELLTHSPKSSTPHDATLDRSGAPSDNESYSLECKVPRRVHFAPDISTIFSMDEASLVEYMDNKNEVSTEFRTELDTCLERLKAEAAALMGLSAAVPKQSAAMGERITSLSRQLASEVKAKDELTTQLAELAILREETVRQREQLAKLLVELQAAREKVTELESREDVTEGYGEQVSHNSLREGLAQLQDQAQTSENEGGVKSPHLHLIEELIREGDRLMDESKHEKDDLKLQIAAADKQLRSTRQFLEQQALEREQERDEYLHEIENLREQLKATDKDRSSNYLRAKEADSLEAQMKEVSGNLQEAQVRKDELESELKAAIEKVWVLRDIITELESQVEKKSRHEATLRKQVEELEAVLEQQNQTNQELMRQLDSGNGELAEHVAYLEEQLHLHRQQMEHLQPDSVQVKQMKTQLREFETTLDKKTKDLESLYTTTLSNTSCSSPSEDVSFRDHIDVMRCATPDETPVSLPLDQLVRVQEKLNTHSRAEQAALKRIRDLEMQVKKLKSNEEEVMAERDVLQNQVDEQLLKISSIKAHLDEQRTKADELVQQASCDLEARLHQREMEIRDLKDAVENKEKQVAVAQGLLEETRQAVAAQEAEWSSRVNKEHVVVQKLKQEYSKLKAESGKMRQQGKQRAGGGEPTEDEQDGAMGKYIPIPVLIDTMLATKNAELEALSMQVDELEQQLRAYMSLNLTDEQRAKLNNMLEDVKATKKDLQAGPSGMKKDRSQRSGDETGARSTEVLYARQPTDEDYSSGAESDMDENDLRNLLLRKESQILSLKNQLAAKELECAEKDELLNKALEKVESASDNISENTDLRTRLKSMEDEQDELERLRSENARLLAENEELRRVANLPGGEGAAQDQWDGREAAIRSDEGQAAAGGARRDGSDEGRAVAAGARRDGSDEDQVAALKRQLEDQAAAMQHCQQELQDQAAAFQRQREEQGAGGQAGMASARSAQDQRDGAGQGRWDQAGSGQGRWDQAGSSSSGADSGSKAEKDALNRKLEEMRRERDALQSQVNEMSGLEAAYNDMQRKDKNLDNIIKERDMLRIRLDDYANMDEEMERLKYRAKEAEVMRMERDRIKAKLDELTTIEAAYLDLLDRSKNLEVIAAERELYKAKYEELAAQENKIEELEKELAELRGVDKERDFLIRQIMDMQCEIADQEDEIRRLVISVDHLARHSQKQEGQMSQSLTDIRTEVETKDKRIAELEAKMNECSALEDEIKSLRDQLKEAIEGVAQDKEEVKSELDKLSTSETRLKADLAEREARMAEREAALLEKQKQIEELQRNISQKDVALRSLSIEREATVHADDYDKLEMELENERRSTKALKDELNALQAENDRLQSELDVLLLKSGKSGTSDKRLGLDETQKQLETCMLELNDYMAKIQALQAENDALHSEVDALRAASGGDSQLEEELVKEKQARMYAERELRSALDKIEEMMADQDKKMEDRPADRSSSCEEMIEHYKQKYESEKQAKDMLQAVLDSRDDELEKHKVEQRKSYEFMEQTKAEMEKLKAEVARLTIDVAKANEQLEKSMGGGSGGSEYAAGEVERLKAELAKVTAERDKLLQLTMNSDNGSLIAELDELKKERDTLKAERDNLKAQLALAGPGSGSGSDSDSDKIQKDLLAQAHEEIQKLTSEVTRLTGILDKANSDTSSSDKAEIADLKAERDLLIAERDSLKAQLSASGTDTDMVPSNLLTDAQQEIKRLNDKINQLTKDLENASSGQDNQVSTDLIKEAQTEVDKLKAEIARLNQELSDSKKNDGGTDKAEIDSLKAQLASAGQDKQQELDKLKAENARLIGQLDNAIKDAAGTAQSEIDKLKAENARLIGQLDNAIKDAAGTAQSEIDNLKAENARLSGLLDNAATDSGGAAKAEIDNLKAQLASAGQDKQQELDKLKAENARLAGLQDSAGTDAGAAAKDGASAALLKQAQQEVEKLKAEIARLNEELNAGYECEAECEKLKNERDNLKAQLGSVNQVKSELDNLKSERDKSKTMQDQQKQADDEIAKLKAEIARLKAQLESATADATNSAKAQIDALKDQLSKADKELQNNRQVTDEVNKLKSDLARMTTERDNLTKENDAREKLIKLSQGSLHDVVQEGKEKITDLQNTIKALQKENESLKKALAIKDESTIDDAAEKAEREKLESIIKKLEGDISSLNSKMVEKEKELKSAKGAEPDVVKNLTSSLEAEQKRNQDLQDELKRLRASTPTTDNAELDKLRKKDANLEAQIAKHDDDKKGLVDNYEKKIVALTASYEDKLKKLNAESMIKLQASFDKFKNSLSPEDHLANVKIVEDKYENKMRTMAEQYEKRLKDMAESHNMDMDQQQQKYNKNLDDLRTTYDRDMKMLTDRHNNSVLKLQKMHESEVSEINQEYEAEVKTMKNASTDTIHTLENKHKAEMEKMKLGQESALNDMKKRHQEEKDALTRKLDGNLDEVKEFHKKEMDEWNTRFDKSFEQTKLENEAQLQRLKDNNKKKIETLKKQYEQLMEDERKKHQEELSKMKGKEGQLTQSKTETYVLGEDKVDALAGQVKKELDISADLDKKMMDRLDDMATRDIGLACSPSLTLILNKVLQQGIDALTFDELSKLHQRTCAATSAMIMQNSSGRLPLEMVPTSLSPEQQGSDKGVLCRRILALEGEIKLRQEEAKQNMCHLENKIRSEEKRLHEMRQVLMEEQRRNIDLHSKLGSQTRRESELESEREVLRRQSTYQEERMQQFLLNLEREKNKVRCLEDNLQKERNNTRHLQSLLEADRFRGRNANIKETDIVETMRIKLENALDNEAKIRIRNEKLESQLRRYQMQPSTCPAPCNPANRQYNNDMQSLLDAEVEKCGSLDLALKREQLHVEQLQVQLERERQQAIERLETEREKREKLRRQISSLEEEKENLSVQLNTARESLCSQRLISESLERKLAAILEMDVGRQRRRDEDDEKNRQLIEKQRIIQFDLEQKVLELQREVADMRDQISAGGDRAKVSDLTQQLGESLQREEQYILDLMSKQPLDVGLSAPLLQKLQSMNALLETHIEENSNTMAAMNQVNLEKQHLQDTVNSLEAQLANRSRSRNLENETEIVNGILEAERTTWARERASLDRALSQAEARASRARSESVSKDDQARHLFGKYLRVESYRKALIWQKRYLLVVLTGYQEAEVKTVKRLSRMARANDGLDETSSETLTSNKLRAVNKFKSCGMVVVAIHRMHYMVRRWRHSRQLGNSILFNRGSTESIPSSTQSSYFNGPRREGSTSSCWSVPRSLSHADVPNLLTRESRVSHSLAHSMSSREQYNRTSSSPTADHVMAVRERYNMLSSSPTREQHMLQRWESDHIQQQLPRRSESVPETSPLHISEYINRFDQLQQTLSLNAAHMPSTEKKLFSHTRQPPTSS